MIALLPGDCLLYRSKGIFGKIISLKTWHDIAHVEIYAGNGKSWASRDGIGVNLFPVRESELLFVLRPNEQIDFNNANEWAKSKIGTPYGWLELLEFINVTHKGKGLFCSEFATLFYRKAGVNLFPTDNPAQVAPFEFLLYIGFVFTRK